MPGTGAIDALLSDLAHTREAFVAALGDVEPALATAPGLLGEWSAREMIAHIGFWCDHASSALDHAAQGRLDDFYQVGFDVDARNANVAERARQGNYRAAREWEESSHRALTERVASLDPALLAARTRFGATVEEVIRENGPDHYREHTEHLRAWWAEGARADEADDDEPDDPDDPDDELDDAPDPGTDDDEDER